MHISKFLERPIDGKRLQVKSRTEVEAEADFKPLQRL